ncbi:hypothetical protein [Candidatus Tisiphia endosymbiont of Oplodontha viridula]|uniref:hypothetical protein n=1 Tax=Candidatus Tisiphia endosymbiont of Oplodontha viridula TaxID=3077925 RepID=UPI0035C93F69
MQFYNVSITTILMLLREALDCFVATKVAPRNDNIHASLRGSSIATTKQSISNYFMDCFDHYMVSQ